MCRRQMMCVMLCVIGLACTRKPASVSAVEQAVPDFRAGQVYLIKQSPAAVTHEEKPYPYRFVRINRVEGKSVNWASYMYAFNYEVSSVDCTSNDFKGPIRQVHVIKEAEGWLAGIRAGTISATQSADEFAKNYLPQLLCE